MTTPGLNAKTIVPFLADIFERRGAEEYLGEPVTMAEHMLQSAWFAEEEGASDELVAAALLHDVGHFTSEFGAYSPDDVEDKHHDEAGAAVLAPFFPTVVTECVRLHVAAKRYLCATDASYDAKLSGASRHSLSLQGGAMSETEIATFRANAFYREAVRVRLWDEAGKVAGMRTRNFGDYALLLQRVVDHHTGFNRRDAHSPSLRGA
jgi:[1-hydroxy-2-(trimethylamino)ethyl]phosphonate dioxygenase